MVKKTKSNKRAKRNTKKGGLFGISFFKTEWDNKRNWRKIWAKNPEYSQYDRTMNYPSRPGTQPSYKHVRRNASQDWTA